MMGSTQDLMDTLETLVNDYVIQLMLVCDDYVTVDVIMI